MIDEDFKKTNKDLLENPPNIIRIPQAGFPHSGFKDDTLWVSLQARELKGINTGQRGGNLVLGKAGSTFKFLAPPEILELHSHQWEEYTSIATRLLQKISSIRTGWDQLQSAYAQINVKSANVNFKELASSVVTGNFPTMQSIENWAGKINLPVPARKIDSPLSYQNSNRREYQFDFELADSSNGKKIVQAVKLLEKYAAPKTNSVIGIEFPHVFKLWSEPEGLIFLKYAVITSIQPTWKYPFKKGYPVRCTLTINVKDMSPLFEKTITEGTIITVKPSSKSVDIYGREEERKNHEIIRGR